MYGSESWAIKRAKCPRIDAFKSWCWRRLSKVPWTARRSNQLTLQEINPEYLLEQLMLELKLQYFGHLMRRADSLEKTLMLGKIEGKRRGWQRMMDTNLGKLWETVKGREAWCSTVHGVTKSSMWFSNWTTIFTERLLWTRFWVTSHLILTITLGSRHCYYPHFTDGYTEGGKQLIQGHISKRWSSDAIQLVS